MLGYDNGIVAMYENILVLFYFIFPAIQLKSSGMKYNFCNLFFNGLVGKHINVYICKYMQIHKGKGSVLWNIWNMEMLTLG